MCSSWHCVGITGPCSVHQARAYSDMQGTPVKETGGLHIMNYPNQRAHITQCSYTDIHVHTHFKVSLIKTLRCRL
jgi:hypothetical protein